MTGAPTPPDSTLLVSTRDGARLHVEIHGAGADTVVVPFAASLAGPLGGLARGRTVIFYDMRSRGRSEPVTDTGRLGFEQDVLDLEDLRTHFGLGRMSLIGFSYLGAVVASYASRWPEQVDRLVLLGAIGPRARGAAGAGIERLDPQRLAALQADYADGGKTDPLGYCREYWSTYLPLYVGTGRRDSGPALAALHHLCELPNERPHAFLPVLAAVSRGTMAVDLRAIGARIRSRTLVLHGDADHVAPLANARVWIEVIAESTLEIVPDAGHLLWAEANREVIEAIDRFLPAAGR
jgi:proline iminopeptidase